MQRNSWGTFFCCSSGLKPLKLARLPRQRFLQSPLSFPKVSPSSISAPTCYFCISLFPSLLLGQMEFGKKQVAAATAAAERVLACSADVFSLSSRQSVCGSGCISVYQTDERWFGQQSHTGLCASVIKVTHNEHLLCAKYCCEISARVNSLILPRTVL